MRGFWDERYREHPEAYGSEPNRFLRDNIERFAPESEIVALAEGQGRNALFLARAGHQVVAVDSSEVAVEQLRERATGERLPIQAVHADLQDWRPPVCDAVIAIYFHATPVVRKAAHRAAWHSLRPGGLFLVEAFHRDQIGRNTGGPRNPEFLVDAQTLVRDLPSEARIELAEDTLTVLREGLFHEGEAAVARVIARKV